MAEPPLDRICIRDMVAQCVVGVDPGERMRKQEVIVNIVLYADLRKAGQTDDIADTIDYSLVQERVLAMIEASSCRLLEALAERIAAVCLETAGVRRVTVSLDKPGALRSARSAGVEITRGLPS